MQSQMIPLLIMQSQLVELLSGKQTGVFRLDSG